MVKFIFNVCLRSFELLVVLLLGSFSMYGRLRGHFQQMAENLHVDSILFSSWLSLITVWLDYFSAAGWTLSLIWLDSFSVVRWAWSPFVPHYFQQLEEPYHYLIRFFFSSWLSLMTVRFDFFSRSKKFIIVWFDFSADRRVSSLCDLIFQQFEEPYRCLTGFFFSRRSSSRTPEDIHRFHVVHRRISRSRSVHGTTNIEKDLETFRFEYLHDLYYLITRQIIKIIAKNSLICKIRQRITNSNKPQREMDNDDDVTGRNSSADDTDVFFYHRRHNNLFKIITNLHALIVGLFY